MAKTLANYLAEQDRAVVASFLDVDWCICAAINRDELDLLAARRQATVQALPGYADGSALVVHHGGFAELWVRARRAGYTAPFRAFAGAFYDFPTSGVPAGYNVDHLFSKGRVQTSGADPETDDRLPTNTLVRMLLVDAAVNKSFGGLMESAMVGTGNPFRPVRRFTYLQLAKALSIDANRLGGGLSGPHQAANFAHVVAGFEAHGVLAGLGMGREQMMRELMTQAETVMHFRRTA